MRWKLLLPISVVAGVIGCALATAIRYAARSYWGRLLNFDRLPVEWLVLLIYSMPICAASAASIFVYRHTARRRKTQAALTALLVLLLSVFLIMTVSRYLPAKPLNY